MQTNINNESKEYINRLETRLKERETLLTEYVNKLFEQEERWIMVNRVIHYINKIMDIKELTGAVCCAIKKITNVDSVSINVFDFQKNCFKEVTYCNEYFSPVIKKSLDKKLSKVAKFIITNKNDETKSFYTKLKKLLLVATEHIYIIPIIINKDFIGAVCIYTEEPLYTNNNTNVIEIICDNYKQSIERINLYQQLEKTNRHKTEFIANITHEFKTPLNAIAGFAQLLKSDNLPDEKVKHFIDNIVNNSQHMLKLIEDVLDVSKIELSHIDLIYEKINTKSLVENVANIMESMCLAKNIQLTCNLADLTIYADKTRFNQIIYNLLNNAIKFSYDCGKIFILTYEENNNFYFEITDEGPGISENVKETIFDMFCQSENDILKKIQGHGLGLFICKNLVILHGGEITFHNEQPQGCTFKFSLPMQKM